MLPGYVFHGHCQFCKLVAIPVPARASAPIPFSPVLLKKTSSLLSGAHIGIGKMSGLLRFCLNTKLFVHLGIRGAISGWQPGSSTQSLAATSMFRSGPPDFFSQELGDSTNSFSDVHMFQHPPGSPWSGCRAPSVHLVVFCFANQTSARFLGCQN